MKIQLEIPDELDRKIQHYKIEHQLISKEAAIIKMLEEHPFVFKVKK